MSVGIVAKHDDSVIGDEDGAALSGHRQEDPSNRFLLSVGPSHASDATGTSNMLSLRPIWQRNLMFSAQTPMQRCFRLGCRTRTTCIHSGRLGPTDIRSPWMPWMTVLFDMRRTNGHSQSLTSSVTRTMRCWYTSVPLDWSTAPAQGTKECRSCKDGDGALTSLKAGCSGVLVSFFEEFYFSIFDTRLRADHRSSLRASKRVTDIASVLADGSEHSLFGQTRTFWHFDSVNRTKSTGKVRCY